jgi:hypothetical protein
MELDRSGKQDPSFLSAVTIQSLRRLDENPV